MPNFIGLNSMRIVNPGSKRDHAKAVSDPDSPAYDPEDPDYDEDLDERKGNMPCGNSVGGPTSTGRRCDVGSDIVIDVIPGRQK